MDSSSSILNSLVRIDVFLHGIAYTILSLEFVRLHLNEMLQRMVRFYFVLSRCTTHVYLALLEHPPKRKRERKSNGGGNRLQVC